MQLGPAKIKKKNKEEKEQIKIFSLLHLLLNLDFISERGEDVFGFNLCSLSRLANQMPSQD